MKTVQLSFIILNALLLSNHVLGQAFEVPTNYTFQTKEDYAKYDQQVIQAVNWLESTPLNQEVNQREQVNIFLMKYLEGSPTISIELREFVLGLTQKNPNLLMGFMGGWAKYQLENPTVTDKLKLNIAGIKMLIKIYQLGGAAKDKSVEKLSKLTSQQELEDWVKSKLI
jgi:hypothetical protein